MGTNIKTDECRLEEKQIELSNWLKNHSVFHEEWDAKVRELNNISTRRQGIDSRQNVVESLKHGGVDACKIWVNF